MKDADAQRRALFAELHALRARLERGGVAGEWAEAPTRYEVRALACTGTFDGLPRVLAGTAGGLWLGNVAATGSLFGWRRLALPLGDGTDILAIQILDGPESVRVALGTGGQGVWLAELSALLSGRGRRAWQALRGFEGATVPAMAFDAHTGQLIAASSAGWVGAWTLPTDLTASVAEIFAAPCPWRVAGLGIDRGPDPSADHLYAATDAGHVFRIGRDASARFALTGGAFLDPAWYGSHGSGYQQVIPLSDWQPARPGGPRGVVAVSLRSLRVLFFNEGDAGPRAVRFRVPTELNLTAALPVRFADARYTLVTSLDQTLHVIGDTRTGSEPEAKGALADDPVSLFGGRLWRLPLPDRAFALAIAAIAADHQRPVLLMGCGDHLVRSAGFASPVRLEAERASLQQALVGTGPADTLVPWLRAHHARRPLDEGWKRTLLRLMPDVLADADGEDEAWIELVHELVFPPGPEDRVFRALGALREIMRRNSRLVAPVQRLVEHLRAFVLDGPSFSAKRTRRLELVDLNDAAQPERAIAFSSILASTGYDPLFVRTFDERDRFGEVRCFTPLLRPGDAPPWWESRPMDPALFLAATWRGLWLLDLDGRALRVPLPRPWRQIRNVYFGGDWVVFSFDDGHLRRTERQRLVALWNLWGPDGAGPPSKNQQRQAIRGLLHRVPREGQRTPGTVHSVCPAPAIERWSEGACLLGDDQGVIWRLDEDGPAEIGRADAGFGPDRTLHDLRSSWLAGPDGPVHVVVAATGSGRVVVLRWDAQRGHLREACHWDMDRAPATVLLWPEPGTNTFVCATWVGQVQCLRVVTEPSGGLGLRLAWSYRTASPVAALHAFTLDSGERRVVLGCYDERLHVLDDAGRLRETIHISGLPVHRFCIAPPTPWEARRDVVCRVFACAFENGVAGLRIVDKSRWIQRTERLVARTHPAPSEEAQLRWRGTHLSEPYLRMRYYRRSATFDEDFPDRILAQLDAYVERERNDRPSTDVVCALVQRLFQSAGGRSGLMRLLDEPEMYAHTVRRLRGLRSRWGLPDSEANRRVQLYWVRAALRSVSNLTELRRWRQVGKAVADEHHVPEADPRHLLEKFLTHSAVILQYKTLQYLERMLFGWPGTRSDPALFADAAQVERADVEPFLDLLVNRLAWRPTDALPVEEPGWVVVEVCRLLRHLLQARLLDPLRLVQRIHASGAPRATLRVLAGQLEVGAADAGAHLDHALSQALAEALRAGHDTLDLTDHRLGPTTAVTLVARLNVLRDFAGAEQTVAPLYRRARRDAAITFADLCRLIAVTSLEQMRGVRLEAPTDRPRPFPASEVFEAFRTLIAAVERYWERKHEDIWVKPFAVLTYEDFAGMTDALVALRDKQRLTARDDLVWTLLDRAIDHWWLMIEVEREHHLLGDFTRTVEETLLSEARLSTDVLDAGRAQAETEEDERYWDLALRNLFVRLALFGEATTGLMIHTVHRGQAVIQRCHAFHWPPGAPNGGPAVRSVDLTSEAPAQVPHDWLDGSGLEAITPGIVEGWLADQPGIEAAVAIPLIIGVGRRRRTQGFLVLGWADEDHAGLRRYEAHRVIRDLVLQSLSIKLMATAQRAFVGRFFSMVAHNLRNPAFVLRSGLGLLRQGHYASAPFDDLREKYNEMYRHAVHMDGIVDSILQFRQHHLTPKLKPVHVARLVRDVVKACRKEIEGRRLRLTYEHWKPHAELQVGTDETWIYEIVQNLLHNAMKYSPKGGTIDVALTPRPAQRRVEITVTDQGPGVPPEERSHIFEMFYRTRAAEESRTQGLGLGLYISRAYTDALGPDARLTVADNPAGQGSVFTLFVPDLSRTPTGGRS